MDSLTRAEEFLLDAEEASEYLFHDDDVAAGRLGMTGLHRLLLVKRNANRLWGILGGGVTLALLVLVFLGAFAVLPNLVAALTAPVLGAVGAFTVLSWTAGSFQSWSKFLFRRLDVPHASPVVSVLLQRLEDAGGALRAVNSSRGLRRILAEEIRGARVLAQEEVLDYQTVRAILAAYRLPSEHTDVEAALKGELPVEVLPSVDAAAVRECAERIQEVRCEIARLRVAVEDLITAERETLALQAEEEAMRAKDREIAAHQVSLAGRAGLERTGLRPSEALRALAEERSDAVNAKRAANAELRESLGE